MIEIHERIADREIKRILQSLGYKFITKHFDYDCQSRDQYVVVALQDARHPDIGLGLRVRWERNPVDEKTQRALRKDLRDAMLKRAYELLDEIDQFGDVDIGVLKTDSEILTQNKVIVRATFDHDVPVPTLKFPDM